MTERLNESANESANELARDLSELDGCLAEVPLPQGLETRILAAATVQTTSSPLRRALLIAVPFAAGVALSFWLFGGRSLASDERGATVTPPKVEAVEHPQPTDPQPGFTIASADCEWSQDAERLEIAAGCRVQIDQPAMALEAWQPTVLSLGERGPTIRAGVVLVAVEHVVAPHLPAQVGVSGGTIEILGTRFVVRQDARGGQQAGGHVDLLEGEVRFVRRDGIVDAVEPGQRYRWSAAVEPVDPIPDPMPDPRPDPSSATERSAIASDPSPTDLELADGLAEVARLRRAGDDEAAIAKLDALAKGETDPRTLEVISYERGTLVERSSTHAGACEFWTTHRERFPAGRYDRELERRMLQLQCASESNGPTSPSGK